MKDLTGRLKRLDSLINALIAEQQLLKKDNEKLSSQLDKCRAEADQKNEELQNVKAELKNARLARGLHSSNDDSQLARAKLSSLMREIDRCMALLNE